VISLQPELIELKGDILRKDGQDETGELRQGSTYVGIVNGVVGKAGQISVRFMDGIQKLIKVKDLNTTQDYQRVYYPGKVIRVGVNKLDRLCTKQKVIEACLTLQGKSSTQDKLIQISSFCKQYAQSIKQSGLQIG